MCVSMCHVSICQVASKLCWCTESAYEVRGVRPVCTYASVTNVLTGQVVLCTWSADGGLHIRSFEKQPADPGVAEPRAILVLQEQSAQQGTHKMALASP